MTENGPIEYLTPLLYTVAESARLLSLGRTKVNQLIATGELASVRVGRAVRVSRQTLEDFAGKGTRGGR